MVYFFICWPLAMAIRWWERAAAEPLMPMLPSFATSSARRVDAARERLIDTTQRLVAVASPNPPSDTA